MKKIIEENYKVTVKRGLITEKTQIVDFLNKIDEEVKEFRDSLEFHELADIILVCLNIAKHYNVDIEKQLINNINKNKKR
jgi:predicted house-cleaning noncanonical NTP pyrophosphatase (MazG superfamily)